MRKLLTGLDGDGRSCLRQVSDVRTAPPAPNAHGVEAAGVFSAGDLVVMPALEHAMRSGPVGLQLVVVSVGTRPRGWS
jgi:hypothetical protein